VKKETFDLVKFGLPTPSRLHYIKNFEKILMKDEQRKKNNLGNMTQVRLDEICFSLLFHKI
jgi:hypothetical protein